MNSGQYIGSLGGYRWQAQYVQNRVAIEAQGTGAVCGEII